MPIPTTVTSDRTTACAWALACALSACALPSDHTENLVVTIEAPSALLLRGRTMVLTAHAWERDASGALAELPGVVFGWRSLRPDLATVDQRSDGTALVTPLNAGRVEIQAVATALEGAEPGVVVLRVAEALAIDSIRPSTVRYGEQVTMYGIGLGEIIRASLGQGDLIPDPATFSGSAQGIGQLSFWVPYPAGTDRLVALSSRGSTTLAPETTRVQLKDLYHELGGPPPRVNLGIPVRGPDTLFYNPALAVVPDEGPDAFQLHLEHAGTSLTFIITSTGPVVTSFDPVLLGDLNVPASFSSEARVETWALGFSGHHCSGGFIATGRPVPLTFPVTVVRALKEIPYQDFLLAIYGAPPGQYTVTVRDGYLLADPRILADRLEEDDYCAAADANATNPDRQVRLPFSDTLTVDNAFELDWLRFNVPPGSPEPPPPGPRPRPPLPDRDAPDSLVTIRIASRPFGASDSSNISLILAGAEDEGGIIQVSRTPGSNEAITARLQPGKDYYVIVLDDGGVATRYSVCLDFGTTCQLFEERGP